MLFSTSSGLAIVDFRLLGWDAMPWTGFACFLISLDMAVRFESRRSTSRAEARLLRPQLYALAMD